MLDKKNKIIQALSLKLVIILLQSVICQMDFCETYDEAKINCQKCQTGFILHNTNINENSIQQKRICVSDCYEFLYWDLNKQKCVSSCNSSQVGDQIHRVCLEINQCPIIYEQGSRFHNGTVSGMIIIYSKQGNYEKLITYSKSDNITLQWDAQTGILLSQLRGHSQPIIKILLTNDPNEILSFTQSGEIIRWNHETGQILFKTNLENGQLTEKSEIDITNNNIISFGFQGEFYMLNYNSNLMKKYIGHQNIVNQVILFNKSTMAITSSQDSNIFMWNLDKVNKYQLVCQHKGSALGIQLYEKMGDETILFSFGGNDDDKYVVKVTLLNLQDFQSQMVLKDHKNPVINIIYIQNTKQLITFSAFEILIYARQQSVQADKLFEKIGINNIQSNLFINYFTEIQNCFIINSMLIAFSPKGVLRVFNFNSKSSILDPLDEKSNTINEIKAKSARSLVLGTLVSQTQINHLYLFGEQIYKFDLKTDSLVYIINNLANPLIQHTSVVNQIDFSEYLNFFISVSDDGLSMLFDFNNGQLSGIFYHPKYWLYKTKNPDLIAKAQKTVIISEPRLACITYSDQSVICFHIFTQQIIYHYQIEEKILDIFKFKSLPYVLVSTLDRIKLFEMMHGQLLKEIILEGRFFYSKMMTDKMFVASSIKGRGTFIDLEYFIPVLDVTTIEQQYQESFGTVLDFSSNQYDDLLLFILSFTNGKIFILNQQIQVIFYKDLNKSLTSCGINFEKYFCTTRNGDIIIEAIDGSYKSSKQMFLYPILQGWLTFDNYSAFMRVNFGSFGGSLFLVDINRYLLLFQYLSESELSGFIQDTHRITYYNQDGQIFTSKYSVETTNTLSRSNDNTEINKIYLIESQHKLIVLSQQITIYEYLTSNIYKVNKMHQQDVKGLAVDQENNTLYTYNDDSSNNLLMWNYETDFSKMLNGHTSAVKGVILINNSVQMLSYGLDGQIIIWDIQTLTQVTIHTPHSNFPILNVFIHSILATTMISLGGDDQVIITNYIDKTISKIIKIQQTKGIQYDSIYQRIFIYGNNISVYNAIGGIRITDFLNFKTNVQNIILEGEYIIAYSVQDIQSIDRSSLNLLHTEKFTKAIYQVSVLKNIIGMIGNAVDERIEAWDYTKGILLSDMRNPYYPDFVNGIYSDNEANIFIVHNVKNQLFTLLPFSQSITKTKDFLFPIEFQDKQYIKSIFLDKLSNKIIIYNPNIILIWKWFNYLGQQGQPFSMPSDTFIKGIYAPSQEQIVYLDIEQNIWTQKQNRFQFQDQLPYIPVLIESVNDFVIISDRVNLYLYNKDFRLLTILEKVYVYKIKKLEESKQNIYLFGLTIQNKIIQFYIDYQTLQFNTKYIFDGHHKDKVQDFIFNVQHKHIIIYDIQGILSIHSYKNGQNGQIGQMIFSDTIHEKLIFGIQFSTEKQKLISFSQDQTINIFFYTLETLKLIKNLEFKKPVEQIEYDSVDDELILWVSFQQIVTILETKTSEFKLKQEILAPGDYLIKLKLFKSDNLLAVYNKFQLNFYQKINKIYQFKSFLRIPSEVNDISDIIFLKSGVQLVSALSSIFVISHSSKAITIDMSYDMQSPSILQATFDNQNSLVQLMGINKKSVFNYTFYYQSQVSETSYQNCYSILQQSQSSYQFEEEENLLQLNQSLQKIKKQTKTVVYNVDLYKSSSFFFTHLTSLNVQKQYFIYDKKITDLNTQIQNNDEQSVTFNNLENFNKDNIILKNFKWKVGSQSRISFSSDVKDISFVNSLINQDLDGVQFTFKGLKTLKIEQLRIEGVNIFDSKFDYSLKSNQKILFQIIETEIIYISDLTIKNCLFSYYSLFQITSSTSVYIENINIESVHYYEKTKSPSNNQNQNQYWDMYNILFQVFNCTNVSIKNINIQNQKINLRRLNVDDSMYLPFRIFQLLTNFKTQVDDVQLKQTKDVILFEISELLQSAEEDKRIKNDIVILKNISIQNCIGVNSHSFLNIQSNKFILQNSKFQNIQCATSNGCAAYIVDSIVQIENSTFTGCKALKGGAIYIENCLKPSNLISGSYFTQNNADQGGAIYIEKSNIEITNSLIKNNQAFIGGGIRYQQYIPDFILNKDKNQIKKQIYSNKGIIFGQDIASYPRYMTIDVSNSHYSFQRQINITEFSQQYFIDEFMSGDSLDFKVQLYDEENEIVKFKIDENTPISIYNELQSYSIFCSSASSQSPLNLTLSGNIHFTSFDMISNSFLFQDLILRAPFLKSQSLVINNSVLFIPDSKNPSLFTTLTNNIKIFIQFRLCKIGEVYKNRTNDLPEYCLPCPEQKYSLINPQEQQNEQKCNLCPQEATFCKGSVINLKNGYWRENNLTDQIINCHNNPSNCIGEDIQNSKFYCKFGYVGPLCEQCDIKGEIWNQTFMNTGPYDCVSCEKRSQATLKNALIVVVAILYMLHCIKKTIEVSILKIQSRYLRLMNIASVGSSSISNSSNIYIKFFMHFLQMSSILYTLEIIDGNFDYISFSVGSPIEKVKYLRDCKRNFAFDSLEPTYARLIWSQLIAFFYLSSLIIIYIVLKKFLSQKQLNKNYLYSGFIFLFLFLQPNIIQGLSQVMTCRRVGSQKFVTSDLTLQCYTDEHIFYLLVLAIPLFLFWVIVLPGVQFLILRKNRLNLNKIAISLQYGPMYNGYKEHLYYWEFIKMTLKTLIIFVSASLNDQFQLKSIANTLMIFLYLIAAMKLQPYKSNDWNQCDQISHMILILCIQLNLSKSKNIDEYYFLQELITVPEKENRCSLLLKDSESLDSEVDKKINYLTVQEFQITESKEESKQKETNSDENCLGYKPYVTCFNNSKKDLNRATY